MMGLDQISAYLGGPALLCVLAALGVVIGVLTGLFGVGGGFLITPLLIVLLGIDESLAVGSSLCFIIGTAAAGCRRHARLNNVEPRCTLILSAGAMCGAVLGTVLHELLRAGLSGGALDFKALMRGLYVALLVVTGYLVYREPREHGSGKTLLQRLPLPPRVELPAAGLTGVSLPGLCLVGVGVGILTGLLGVGGGVLFMPILLLVVGLTAHQAVGTSLGVILFSSIAGTLHHGMLGNVSLWIAMALLVGSSLGVQLGAWLCVQFHADRIRRYFAIIVFLAAAVVAADLAVKLHQ
jgi:uncharacterized membrane protein YfcA